MGFLSIISTAISSACSTIGSALSSFASSLGPVLSTIATHLPKLGEALGQFANNFLQAVGILKPDEDVKQLGERALQAAQDGITPEKFDDFDDYVQALRNFEIDPDKAKKRNDVERLVVGLGVGSFGLEQKFEAAPGSLSAIWLLPVANPEFFTVNRMDSLLQQGKLSGDIFGYLERKLSAGDAYRMEEGMADALVNSSVVESKQSLFAALDKASDNWHSIKNSADNIDKE
ncbi:hypothetical protein [Shewanella xiamenensis]|uniref:hypothetical protein n=1 Tax=Shewanella xiamenensis TaxID=332186 RepID=UPI001C4F38F1|nr:hypothetical protein [Shewanella xiamenensis]MBW0281480.1 hypothetical protein [Shewanella xiamenensis]MCT8872147.1 hypothetical protein [Shewanella xiamenensis]UWH40054.1 hypothetical protein KXJ80_12000 [Shewanella xiamenensis]